MSYQLMAWATEQETGSPSRKAVLIALANRANHDTGLCCPSVEAVAKETELSRRTVLRALDDLEETGLIGRERQRRKDGSWSVYHYRFPMDTVSSPGDTVASDPGDTVAPQEEPGSKTFNQEEAKASSISQISAKDVDRVYEHWRSKRGKARANYATISPIRRRKIQTRLREFSADDLCLAIDNISKDPWPERALHDDITVIFRSREQVERFLEFDGKTRSVVKPSRRDAAEEWVRATGWGYPDADFYEELGRFDLEPASKSAMVKLALEIQERQKALA